VKQSKKEFKKMYPHQSPKREGCRISGDRGRREGKDASFCKKGEVE
jgi:hypothetical protein